MIEKKENAQDLHNNGLDVFRIMCCLGVLGYHVFDDVLTLGGGIGYALYFSCSFCVPGFFLLSGFLIGKKSETRMEYYEKKIVEIWKKVFGWVVVFAVITFILSGEVIDIWSNTSGSFMGNGILPIAWFLLTYMILMLISPLLCAVVNKHPNIIVVLASLLIIFMATGVADSLKTSYHMSLWFHLYGSYFLVGIALSIIMRCIHNKKRLEVLAGLVFMISSVTYAYKVYTAEVYINPDEYYGKIYYTIWLISLFVFLHEVKIKSIHVKKAIKHMANNTFSVYMGHLPILQFIYLISPLNSLLEATLRILIVFSCLQIVAEIFRRLPLLRKVV